MFIFLEYSSLMLDTGKVAWLPLLSYVPSIVAVVK